MIIDKILDRQEGTTRYNTKQFYDDVMQYGEIGWDIAEALDNGKEADVKRTLCNYIVKHNYNLDIFYYIQSVKWIV